MRFLARHLIGLLASLSILAGTAQAADLDSLRKSGAIAERYDGFVEVHGAADGEAQRVVAEVNAERRSVYEKRAAEQKVPATEVAKIYASQILAKLPSGVWYRKPDGSVAQK